jgi:hypothetical protein
MIPLFYLAVTNIIIFHFLRKNISGITGLLSKNRHHTNKIGKHTKTPESKDEISGVFLSLWLFSSSER